MSTSFAGLPSTTTSMWLTIVNRARAGCLADPTVASTRGPAPRRRRLLPSPRRRPAPPPEWCGVRRGGSASGETMRISVCLSVGSALMRLMSAAPRAVEANTRSSATTAGLRAVIVSERAQRVGVGKGEQFSAASAGLLFQRRQRICRRDEHSARLRHRRNSILQDDREILRDSKRHSADSHFLLQVVFCRLLKNSAA